MNKQFKEFLTFTKGEKEGVISLGILILLLLGLNFFFSNQSLPKDALVNSKLAKIDRMVDSIQNIKANQSKISTKRSISTSEENTPHLNKKFNPNNFNLELGTQLGLTDKQSSSILKYIDKGGKFKIKSDFKKMYVISNTKYESIKKYIDLPDKYPTNQKVKKDTLIDKYKKPSKFIIVDINTADSSQLIKIKGIGAYYAKSIVKYRKQLGGYIYLSQLKEVYLLDEKKYQLIVSHFTINDSIPIRRLNINKAEIEELGAHPYIDWNVAKTIVNYRKVHGVYTHLKDIQKLYLIDSNLYRKIAPYLRL